MSGYSPFNCIIIGEGTLPIQCIGILLQQGHRVSGLISPDPALLAWAARRQIPGYRLTTVPPGPIDLSPWLTESPFDYLFSLVNDYILPAHVLALPRLAAINYHNGPLPRYAGNHATSWAILHGETDYAITWHLMTEQVNAGDILQQVPVDIAADDTALTLNAKCYDAAIQSFTGLVTGLAQGQVTTRPQDLSARTYFARCLPLTGGGVLDWTRPARTLNALVRALSFGHYPNPLGLPRLLVGANTLVVQQLDVLNTVSQASPGTILAVHDEAIGVATADYDVVLSHLGDSQTQPLTTTDIVARFGLAVGDQLPTLDLEQARRLVAALTHRCRHEPFWIARLADLQPLTLPYHARVPESPAGDDRRPEMAAIPLPVPPDLADCLRSLAPAGRLDVGLLAGLVAYLARLTSQAEFDLGLMVDGALPPTFFAPYVPLRAAAAPSWSLARVYRALQAQLDLLGPVGPYTSDLAARYPRLGAAHRQTWPVSVALVDGVADTADLTCLGQLPDSDLTLVFPAEGAMGYCLYQPQRWAEPDLNRLLDGFNTFLQGILANPGSALADLPLLPAAERQQLLVTWNQTQAAYPPECCLHQLFEAQVERTPEAVALVYSGGKAGGRPAEQLTYRELDRRANRLACYLQDLGAGPETLVGLCLDRSPAMVVALLAILKSGAAYVPLDPAYPQERLLLMLADSQARVVLTEPRLRETLSSTGAHLVCPETAGEILAAYGDARPAGGVMADNLAYVLFTSGSTGRPKGVAIAHHSPVSLISWAGQVFPPEDRTGVLASTSICFDLSVFELFLPLSQGGMVVLVENALDLLAQPSRWPVTLVNTVPSVIAEVLRAGPLPQSVRTVNLAGEPLQPDLVERLYLQPGVVRVFDLYGPSETTTYSTCALREPGGPATIGRPIANTQIYLLDAQGQPVPIGVPGEIYIGGVGVARGYLHHPQVTAEKFIPNPFSQNPGERLYRTGDLARYRPDGQLEFMGRLDYQVKLRGFRIELPEIEATLAQHPDVRENAVIIYGDTAEERRLVAYIVPRTSGQVTDPRAAATLVPALRSFLKARLPGYMVPATLTLLPALPLTQTGKIDRRALPAPSGARPATAGAYVPPRTPAEEIVAGIWASVLGLEQVGAKDNFFELGGQSLLATRVISRLRDVMQVELPLRVMFEAATVTELVERIEALQRAAVPAPPPLRPGPRGSKLLLSFAQQRLWFFDQLEPGNPAYNEPLAFHLRGPLNQTALAQSLSEIVRRHEVLRTTFVTVAGEPVQVIGEAEPVLTVVDLRHLRAGKRLHAARRRISTEVRRSFNLDAGPLLRMSLYRLAEAEHILLLVTHHIVSDGWSIEVFLQELSALYIDLTSARPLSLAALPFQYADFATWQRQLLQGEFLADQLAYWQKQLAGPLPMLQLPTDRPRPAVQTFRGARQTLALSADLTRALKRLSQAEGVTLFMTLLAAFKTLLHRYTGQEDILVGTPIANRNRSELEALIGYFANTLVLRTNLAGDPPFRELLGRVRDVALGAYAHQDLPFEKLVEELQPERDLSHQPLFQVMFVLQNALPSAIVPAGLTVVPFPVDPGTAKFDLTLFIEESGPELVAILEYNVDLFDAATITRMLGHWETLLTGIAAGPGRRLSALPLLTLAERRQILDEWNRTAVRFEPEQLFPQRFESQAAQIPTHPALRFGRQSLTYAELNRQANALACYLGTLGIGPGSQVGLYLERSPEMVVALLAILKAGGAYLPLDPLYPPDRLAFMLADSQARVVITRQGLRDRLNQPGLVAVCLDDPGQDFTGNGVANPPDRLTGADLVYTIYTSGSTGQPKGVMVTHGGLANYLAWAERTYPVTAGKAVPVHSSLSFDLTVTSLLLPLWVGQTVVLLPEDEQGGEALLAALAGPDQFSLVKLTPAHLEFLNNQLPVSAAAQAAACLVIGGEVLLAGHLAFWQDHAPATRLFNEYGPTETVVGCCIYEALPEDHQAGPIPIGRPIANTQIYLLDRHLQPVPVGVPAELYIGGAGVARGYLNRPALTAERFVPNPFSSTPGERLYKTGDLARYRPDGCLEFLGRLDHQVKIRGFRIELEEIETALTRHPGIQEAVVLAREDVPGTKFLVAYIVPTAGQPGEGITAGAVRTFLQASLPYYMLPAAFVFLPALPLTPNGKVDRRALPAPESRAEPGRTYVPPQNRAETILAEIWCDLLNLKRVSTTDNFFELGGDSILSIQVIARANGAGLRLTPRQLFQHQTIAELAAVAGTSLPSQVEQGPVSGSAPLTPIQRWFFEKSLPNPQHWNQAQVLEVRQPLEPAWLEQALATLVYHHDALRLRFVPSETGWQQCHAGVGDPRLFSLAVLDPGQSLADIAADLQAGLDLTRGPLLQAAFQPAGPGQPARLLLVVHHLVIDGVSWRILLEDLQMACQQLSQDEPIRLPAKSTSYRRWAEQLEIHAQDGEGAAELAYWLNQPWRQVTCLPVDDPAGPARNTEGSIRVVSAALSSEETRALLQDVPAAYGTRINDVLLTALAQTFARWFVLAGRPAPVLLLDLEGHGREDIIAGVDLSRTVGWFTSIFPVLLDLTRLAHPGDALKSIKEQVRRIPRHGIGYGLLRYLSREESTRSALQALPQAEIAFNYLGQFDQALPGSALFQLTRQTAGPDRSPQGQRHYLLEVDGSIIGGRLQLDWLYSGAVHRAETVQGLADAFVAALRELIAHCQAPGTGGYTPADFPEAGLSQAELDDLLAELGEM